MTMISPRAFLLYNLHAPNIVPHNTRVLTEELVGPDIVIGVEATPAST